METLSTQNRYKVVKRGEDLTLVPTQGLYNQPLFDLCAPDSLLSFVLMNSYSPALDAIGFETSNLYRLEQNMITYIAASGAAAGSPTTSDLSDPCAPGNGTEFGGINWVVEGWGRMRRTSDPRDITDVVTKYCLKTPVYTIGGEVIADDYEWDRMQLSNVILQDYQRRIINGNASSAGQADGLEQLITYGYTDPITGEVASSMDSTVIDYNENLMCSADGASDVTFNGNAIPDGSDLYSLISSFLRRTRVRINNSPNLTGAAKHIGLLSSEHMNALIECYVCHTTCGGELGQMMEVDARKALDALKSQLMSEQAITLSFQGVPVTFFTYDYGLISSTAIESNGTILGDIYILTTDVGNTPLMRLQVKSMTAAANHDAMSGTDMEVTDNGRFLSWKTYDNTCYRVSIEMQYRWRIVAPWAQMRITDVAATTILGAQVADPLSDFFWETNIAGQRYAKANRVFQSLTVPVGHNQFYERTTAATTLTVTAGNGLLREATGNPAPTAVVATSAATTGGGAITIAADGSFSYVPPSATYAGVDTYVFTVTNSQGTDTATVTIVSHTVAA